MRSVGQFSSDRGFHMDTGTVMRTLTSDTVRSERTGAPSRMRLRPSVTKSGSRAEPTSARHTVAEMSVPRRTRMRLPTPRPSSACARRRRSGRCRAI